MMREEELAKRRPMMRAKTHPIGDGDQRNGGDDSPIPDFAKSPLIITKKMISKRSSKNTKKQSTTNSSTISSSSGVSRSDQMLMMNQSSGSSKPTTSKMSSSLGSIMAVIPLSPSPVCSSHTGTTFSSPSSHLPCDHARSSGDYYTPTHHGSSALSVMSFKKYDDIYSPKCLSMSSTVYESAIDHGYRRGGFDSHRNALRTYTYSPKSLASSLPRHGYASSTTTTTTSGQVPEDVAGHRQRRRQSRRPDQPTGATAVKTEQELVSEEQEEEHTTPVNRPKPYQEFLDEVQNNRRSAELSARRKAVYTHMLDQLRKRETAIDDWESKRRGKQELQLDKLERKLEKKRAKAVQKMHQKVAEINVAAERRKVRERRSFLKKIDKLAGRIQANKPRATMLLCAWCYCCIPVSEE